jgi:hypothetical protein
LVAAVVVVVVAVVVALKEEFDAVVNYQAMFITVLTSPLDCRCSHV